MLKPVLPYLSDGINHIFFYAKHMATVHYGNGKYHVHYETAKEAKEAPATSSNSNSKKDNTSNEYVLMPSKETDPVADFKDVSLALATTPSLLNSTIQNNYPPPRL